MQTLAWGHPRSSLLCRQLKTSEKQGNAWQGRAGQGKMCSPMVTFPNGECVTLGVAVAVSAIMGTPGKQPEVTTPTCL